jgi:hypothetical protein
MTVRIRATCNTCGRDFLFFQLYVADTDQEGRCPHCQTHLRVSGARHLALFAERSAATLLRALEDLASREPGFTVQRSSVLDPIEAALQALSAPPDDTRNEEQRRWLRRPLDAKPRRPLAPSSANRGADRC